MKLCRMLRLREVFCWVLVVGPLCYTSSTAAGFNSTMCAAEVRRVASVRACVVAARIHEHAPAVEAAGAAAGEILITERHHLLHIW